MQEKRNKSFVLVMVTEMGKRTSYFLFLLCYPENNLMIPTTKSNGAPKIPSFSMWFYSLWILKISMLHCFISQDN